MEASGCPFLPTPMGKGVIRDDHDQCVSPARSLALLKADVIVLVGARLNWMLHFGKPPRCESCLVCVAPVWRVAPSALTSDGTATDRAYRVPAGSTRT